MKTCNVLPGRKIMKNSALTRDVAAPGTRMAQKTITRRIG
jgi:hypothetical protein